jgi:hypothetical protein
MFLYEAFHTQLSIFSSALKMEERVYIKTPVNFYRTARRGIMICNCHQSPGKDFKT